MFQTNNRVEDGRVRAHETAETAAVKVHEIIDKVAEQTEHGSERAHELREAAAEQAAAARANATARAEELRAEAEQAKKDAKKNAGKRRKAAAKDLKKRKKKAGKATEHAGEDIADARDRLVGTAGSLAAAGLAAGRKAADEAVVRGPEVMAALRDERDTGAALDAAKGKSSKPEKKGRKRKLFLLALIAGGVAAVAARTKLAPKKDPWAVPTGDPYKAPTTGRDSSVTGGIAATGVAPAAEAADTAPVDPALDPALDPGPRATSAEGTDAWTSAQDWADNDSSVPSTTDATDHADLAPEHLDGDLPVDRDDKL